MRTITRTAVDRVEVYATPDPDWTVCEYTPATSTDPTDTWMSPSADVDGVDDIDRVLSLTRYRYVAVDAPDVINDRPIEQVMFGDEITGLPKHPVFVDVDLLRLTLEDDGAVDPSRILAFDGWDHALLRPGSDRPVNRVVTIDSHLLQDGESGEFDIAAARNILEAHEWVRRVTETRGWDGPRLRFDIKVPDDIWDAACDTSGRRHGDNSHPRGRSVLQPNLERLVVWPVRISATGDSNSDEPWWSEVIGPDPLGLAEAWTGAA